MIKRLMVLVHSGLSASALVCAVSIILRLPADLLYPPKCLCRDIIIVLLLLFCCQLVNRPRKKTKKNMIVLLTHRVETYCSEMKHNNKTDIVLLFWKMLHQQKTNKHDSPFPESVVTCSRMVSIPEADVLKSQNGLLSESTFTNALTILFPLHISSALSVFALNKPK